MKAEDARKLTFEHSKRMLFVYKQIEESARRGNSSVTLDTSAASKEEMEVLRKNGFTATYEPHEIDGGQYLLIKW